MKQPSKQYYKSFGNFKTSQGFSRSSCSWCIYYSLKLKDMTALRRF